MEIETLEIAGLRSAIESVYLSYNKKPRAFTGMVLYNENFCTRDVDWMQTGAITYGGMIGFDREHKDIKLLSQLVIAGDEHAKPLRGIIVYVKIKAPIYWWYEAETYTIGHQRLMSESTMHTEARGLSGKALQDVKANIPMGHLHTKIDCFSYQALRRIVHQRKNHRLPEWHIFDDWCRTLPYAKELIYA